MYTTIQEANELSNKSPINAIQVSVKKAFEPTEGEGQFGPWKMQAAILKDDTGEIRATFWDRFNLDLRNFEGEDLTVVSGRDGKDRFSGILTDDYKGKRQLRIAKEAKFESPDGEGPEPDENGVVSVEESGGGVTYAAKKRFVSEETKRASIEKQVALREAVLSYGSGTEWTTDHIVTRAKAFYEFMHGQEEVI